MRKRRVARGSRGLTMNTVSDRLNSRAIFCMKSVGSSGTSVNTASGLPPNRWSVKTSSVQYFSFPFFVLGKS